MSTTGCKDLLCHILPADASKEAIFHHCSTWESFLLHIPINTSRESEFSKIRSNLRGRLSTMRRHRSWRGFPVCQDDRDHEAVFYLCREKLLFPHLALARQRIRHHDSVTVSSTDEGSRPFSLSRPASSFSVSSAVLPSSPSSLSLPPDSYYLDDVSASFPLPSRPLTPRLPSPSSPIHSGFAVPFTVHSRDRFSGVWERVFVSRNEEGQHLHKLKLTLTDDGASVSGTGDCPRFDHTFHGTKYSVGNDDVLVILHVQRENRATHRKGTLIGILYWKESERMIYTHYHKTEGETDLPPSFDEKSAYCLLPQVRL